MNFDDYETLPTTNFTTHMTAGAIAGVMEHCIMYPLDSVKTRMQSLRSAHNGSIAETFRYMVQREGLLRPVRGMSAVVLGAGPAHACYFATYEHCKRTLAHLTRHRHDHITHGLSGCLASLVHDAVSNPTEVVKQRLQMLHSPYRGVWECARRVYRAEGARAFYRSYGTQVAMNVPYTALHFVVYEAATAAVNPARAYDPAAHAASGAAAGAVAAAATTPLDVCKTVLNTQEAAARPDSLLSAARTVLAASGPAGFFRGVTARVLYQMPAAAICWLTYETFKHVLAQRAVPAPPAHLTEGDENKAQENSEKRTESWEETPSAGGGAAPSLAGGVTPPLACAALRLAAAGADGPLRTT